jgi:hypothetical protein
MKIVMYIRLKYSFDDKQIIPVIIIVSLMRFSLIWTGVVITDKLFDIIQAFSMFLRNMIGGF